MLVGAGGAGKTTCCAALLSAYRAGSTLPASFATLIHERHAAGRPEWRLLMSPAAAEARAPSRPRAALRALRRARSDGLAVLDTPRVSPSDRKAIREARAAARSSSTPTACCSRCRPRSAGPRRHSCSRRWGPLKADALVVTHADETDQIGVAVEAACRFGLAPEYMLSHARGGGWQLRRLDPAGLAAMVLP